MKQAIKLLVSLALITFAVYFLDFQSIVKIVTEGSAKSFILAVIINILTFLVLAVRWHILIVPTVRLPFLKHVAFYFRGTFLNTFTPANLGGDAYRLVVLRKNAAPSGTVVKLLVRERIMGFYGFVFAFVVAYILVLFSMDFNVPLAENPYTYGVIVALGVFPLPLIARPLGASLASTLRGVIGIEKLPKLGNYVETLAGLVSLKAALPLMLLTFCSILLWIISIKIIAEGFGLVVPLIHLATVATLVEIIRLLPITIQGIGLREVTFSYLLAFLGHNPEQCYAVGAIAYLALSVAIILSGPIGLLCCLVERETQKIREA